MDSNRRRFVAGLAGAGLTLPVAASRGRAAPPAATQEPEEELRSGLATGVPRDLPYEELTGFLSEEQLRWHHESHYGGALKGFVGLDADRLATVERMERDSGLTGAALSLMNLLLAAHAQGLGASAMTGPLVAEPELRTILPIPDSWGIVALVPIGYPAETPQPTARKDLAKVVRWL